MRNALDALEFVDTAADHGVGRLQPAPPDRRPDPAHVIVA